MTGDIIRTCCGFRDFSASEDLKNLKQMPLRSRKRRGMRAVIGEKGAVNRGEKGVPGKEGDDREGEGRHGYR